MRDKLRKGDVVELQWLDAVYYTDWDESAEAALKAGGELCILIGVIAAITSKAIVLAGEMDAQREPFRDFNLIPRPLVKHIKIIRKGKHVNK